MERRKTTHVKDIVKDLVKKIDQEKKIGEEELLKVWKETVGLKASENAKPVSLYRKRLKVSVKNPGWIQELTMNQRRILKKLQSYFGKELIAEIRFKTDEF